MTLATTPSLSPVGHLLPPWPQFDDRERQALGRALDQGQWWRCGGAEVSAFETEFAAHHGAAAALAVTNGTHALEVALQMSGVGPGDEVVIPALTFIATAIAVQRVGAVPVPVDVDLDTWCLAERAAAEAVTERTRAIVPVHMAGHVADMDSLPSLAARHGAALVQDAAHAHGARWRGVRLGELGSIATFSFQNGKLMTAGEGGALLLPSRELWSRAFVHHNCGRTGEDRVYDHTAPGSNYRLNEFSAAVLRAQLTRLDEQTRRREARAALLDELLASIPGVVVQGRDPRCDVHSHYMAMFRLDDDALARTARLDVVDRLVAAGAPAFVTYPPVYRTGTFWSTSTSTGSAEELAERCPVAERIGATGVWLHHRVLLAGEDGVRAVASCIAAALHG